MPRPLRIEFQGAAYLITSRGDRGEPIFADDHDRKGFLMTLEEACEKTAWVVHAYCLLGNHFHLVVETPQPNLVAGMKWFLGTYTGRHNRRHHFSGHLFSGRYKSLHIDSRRAGYLRIACDYAHLNPVRSGLVTPDQPLAAFPWSSYPAYLQPPIRPPWLRVDRLLAEYGIHKDSPEGRVEFRQKLEIQRREPASLEYLASLRRGWRLGGPDFLGFLTDKLGRAGHSHELARERRETDALRAERLVQKILGEAGWTEHDLEVTAKGHPIKARIASRLRRETPMTREWIARRLRMGSASYVSLLLGSQSD